MEDIRMGEKDRKRMILERLQTELDSAEIPAVIRKKEEEELPMDILAVLLTEYGSRQEEASAELYFLPLPNGAEGVCYFSSVITLTESIDPLCLDAVCKAVAMINFYLEYGAYVVDVEGSILAYKMVTPIFEAMDDEQLFATVDMNFAHALDAGEDYAGILVKLSEGACSLDDVMDLLPQM